MKKYIIGGLSCLFTLSILFRLSLSVEAEDNVFLHANGNKASVVLETDEMRNEEGKSKDEIVSLQISFQIETKTGDSQKNQIAFDFDKSITSAVKQYRYHKESGILNVYIAGKEDLCQAEQLSLGSIVMSSDQENGSSASVKIVEQSLITVNKAFDKQTAMLGSGSIEAKADLVVGNGGKEPDTPPTDNEGETPPSNGDNSEPPPSNGDNNEFPPPNNGDNNEGNPSDGDNGNENPSDGDNNTNSSENRKPSKGSSHSSSNSQQATSNSDASLNSTLRGLLNRRPKTVQSTASVATTDDTEDDASQTSEEDQVEPLPEEEAPKQEPDTKEEEEGFFSDKEEVVEKVVDVGLVASIVAGIVVVILIVLEYRRQWLRRHHKDKK